MKKKYEALLFAGVVSALLAGCGNDEQSTATKDDTVNVPVKTQEKGKLPCCDLSQSKDGDYSAESSTDQYMGHGKIAITIKDHKIAAVNFVGIDPEGNIKDENYGKTNGKVENPGFYQKAQRAMKANAKYAEQLLQVQELDKVDVISGATASYNQFMESAQMALEEAQK